MLKRVFYTGLGLGAGAVAGVYVVRKIEATQRKLTPEHLAAKAGASAGTLGGRVRSAVAEGRAAAAAREAELRTGYQRSGVEGVAPPGGGAAE